MNKLTFVLVMLFAPSLYAQAFVTECTLDQMSSGEEVLCQTNGVWGTCLEENGVPDCGIAYCASGATRGDACVVAGESGGCIPICEVDFDIDCNSGGMELVCEIGAGGTMDEGDEINCSTGSGAMGPSLLAMLFIMGGRRRRR